MKRIIIAVLLLALIASLAGCSNFGNSSTDDDSRKSYETSISAAYPVEYHDQKAIMMFEEKFQCSVNLEEFDSNEDIYEALIKSKDGEWDVVVVSDYMVDRCIQENRLAKLDHSKIPSMSGIASQYLGPAYDPDNSYHVPYMVGTVGILYNTKNCGISSWAELFDLEGFLMMDSERDGVGIALKTLGYSMNSVDTDELREAQEVLRSAKRNIGGFYETADIVEYITAYQADAGVVYSGDGKLARNLSEETFAFVIPEEGSNRWVDAFVIPKDSAHVDLAHEFIEFMCQSHVAKRNMDTTGYTSPIQEAWSEYAGDLVMFTPSEDLARCEAFTHSPEIVEKHHEIWSSVRGSWKEG